MPHLVVLYTPDLAPHVDMGTLCRRLADAMLSVHDESGRAVFPTGGTRVLAYPATHFAVADGSGEHGFLYLNLRMASGRSAAVRREVGEVLSAALKAHLAPLLATRRFGVTLQIDEGHEVFDAKLGNLHAVFGGPAPAP